MMRRPRPTRDSYVTKRKFYSWKFNYMFYMGSPVLSQNNPIETPITFPARLTLNSNVLLSVLTGLFPSDFFARYLNKFVACLVKFTGLALPYIS